MKNSMDERIQFYEDKFGGDFSGVEHLANDSTTHITVPTPEDWKCNREGCRIDYYHEHGIFPCLNK